MSNFILNIFLQNNPQNTAFIS